MSSARCCLGLLYKCGALQIQRGRVASKKAPQGEAAQPHFTRPDSSVSSLAARRWCPDSRHIVNTNEVNVRSPRPPKAQRFSRTVPRQVRMTLWSLTSRSSIYVPHPKACEVSFTALDGLLSWRLRAAPRDAGEHSLPASGHRACRSCFAGVMAAFNAHTGLSPK
jgi:hypothetical protein